MGQSSRPAENDGAALPGNKSPRNPRSHVRRRHPRPHHLRKFLGKKGPVDGIAADPIYLDVSVPPGQRWFSPSRRRGTLRLLFAGSGKFCNASGPLAVPTESVGWSDTTPPTEADNRSLILFDSGDEVAVQAGDEGIRFLLVSGKPLQEPVAWYGPIVMNTQGELQQVFEELNEGTFLATKARI